MNTTPENAPESLSIQPPRLMPSFIAGFNTVASNVGLIVPPVLLDLLLWFGPHLRLKTYLLPMMLESIETLRKSATADARIQIPEGMEQFWGSLLEHYNLLGNLNTFPVGIPSMMAGLSPLKTPMGDAQIVEINSGLAALGLLLLVTVVGMVLGSLYFAIISHFSVARTTDDGSTDDRTDDEAANDGVTEPAVPGDLAAAGLTPPAGLRAAEKLQQAGSLSLRVLAWQMLQVLLLMIILLITLMILFVPAMFITTLLVIISPALATLALMAMTFLMLWLMIPLIFSPHGIFVLRLNALSAMLTSARLVRFFLPGTGLFLLMTVVLYQGLGALWRTPPDTSWMALVGILGHAFISTALLSASFFYYRSGHEFVLSLRKSINSA